MWNIALNTFRELRRNKILSLIVFFGFVFIAFSLLLRNISLGDHDKLVIDFGIAMMEIFSLVLVVFVGSQILFKEIEGKTIYLILTKPIRRSAFIYGKFFGFAALLKLIIFTQAGLYLGLLFFQDIPLEPLFFFAIIGVYLKLLITFALVLFFSSFIGPLLSILAAGSIYLVSHGIPNMLAFATSSLHGNAWLEMMARTLYVILPNFHAINVKNMIANPFISLDVFQIGTTSITFPYSILFINFLYSVIYLTVIVFLTATIFERKNFEQ